MKHSVKDLDLIANTIRVDIIKMLEAAGSGHSAGPLGMADVFTALYFEVLNHRPQDPEWEDRDRLILSNGHIVPIRYATMAEAGYFPKEELLTLRKFGSRLQGHPERVRLPGMESTSGPLGSGLSQAAGIGLGLKLKGNTSSRVYVCMGDGELNEGNVWEAAMFASARKINNLTAIIDRNNIQIDGFTETVMPLEPLAMKWQAFGWHVIEVDGHNIEQIVAACLEAQAIFERPTVLIAHTIPGKGVDYMEREPVWHGMPPGLKDIPGDPPKDEQVKVALAELRTLRGKIRGEHE
ncbi:MAG: transketolase [bacterium]